MCSSDVNDTAKTEKDAQSGLTNLNLSSEPSSSIESWINLLRNSTYDENCSFLAWIDDTSLPVADSVKLPDSISRLTVLYLSRLQ